MEGTAADSRPPHKYELQERRIEAYLRSGITREQAAATVGRGPELGIPSSRGTDAPWVRFVVNKVDRQPRHLREMVPAVLRLLPFDQRWVVQLHGRERLSFREIERWQDGLLGISRATAQRRWRAALRALAHLLYDDQDEPRWHLPPAA